LDDDFEVDPELDEDEGTAFELEIIDSDGDEAPKGKMEIPGDDDELPWGWQWVRRKS